VVVAAIVFLQMIVLNQGLLQGALTAASRINATPRTTSKTYLEVRPSGQHEEAGVVTELALTVGSRRNFRSSPRRVYFGSTE
jgi:hypothetical protein